MMEKSIIDVVTGVPTSPRESTVGALPPGFAFLGTVANQRGPRELWLKRNVPLVSFVGAGHCYSNPDLKVYIHRQVDLTITTSPHKGG